MFKIAIENSRGEKLEINEELGYAITGVDGLTPPKMALNFATAGLKDGSTFNSSRAENRNIVLTIKVIKNIEKNRIKLYKYFSLKDKLYFYFANDSRDLFIECYLESLDGDLFENGQTLQASLIAPDPFFKRSSETQEKAMKIVNLFKFPFAIDSVGIPFSEIGTLSEKNIYNDGDVSTGIKIELRASAAVVNPVIYKDGGGSFGLNYTLQPGDLVIINTIPGEKSVSLIKRGVTTNLINRVMSNPDWFKVEPGDNLFYFNAASQTEMLEITFKHYENYVGV